MQNKKILLAFFGICFAWTFSWFALKHQAQSSVSIYTSLSYRFIAAGVLCFFISKKLGYSLKIHPKYYKYILISALCNAFLNFAFGYKASQYIPSGMIAAISSLAIISNELFNSFMIKQKPSRKTIKSGLIGTAGLILFIYPTLQFSSNLIGDFIGFSLAILMAIVVCPGYYAMRKATSESKMEILVFMAYIFIVGGVISLISSAIAGNKIDFDFSINYISSLLYLIIIASCLGYISLYYLINKLGAAKANYASLIYTVGAIWVSTIFEDYTWSIINFFGFAMILLSIYMQFGQKQEIKSQS